MIFLDLMTSCRGEAPRLGLNSLITAVTDVCHHILTGLSVALLSFHVCV